MNNKDMNERIRQLEKRLKELNTDCVERVDLLNELARNIWAADPMRAIQITHDGLELAKKLEYEKGIAYAQWNAAFMDYSQGNMEKTLDYASEALQWFQNNKDLEGQANLNVGLGILYWGIGDFQKGFDFLWKALEIYQEKPNLAGHAWALHTMGSFYFDSNEFKQALEYYERSYDLFKKNNDPFGVARALNGLGNVYHSLGEEEKALLNQTKSLKEHRRLQNKYGESKTLNDMGIIYQDLGQLEKALKYHKESLKIREELSYPQGESTSLLDIGNVYMKLNKPRQAMTVLRRGLDRAQKINAKPKICRAHYFLSHLYKKLGDVDKAFEHFEKFHEIEEEVFHEDAETKIKNIKAAYEMEASKQEAEIHRLRNVELKKKNNELKKVINEFKTAQAQLLQSEKMAALGKLIAGITHEVNTPVGTIKSIIDTNNKSINKINGILSNDGDLGDSDLRNLLKILEENNGGINSALSRVITIIKSLKGFTNLDKSPFQKGNVNDGIESTLTLLKHELSSRIKVVREYGEIPEIYHYPPELNQVFMNIILNAIKAIEGNGTIGIKTFQENENIIIQISDSGYGIPSAKIKKLFEPGFTAKGANIRMRTGLFSSYNIVQKHKGKIRVDSEVGKGTVFTLSVPMNLEKLLNKNVGR